jgi:hypothetical protein
VVTTIGTILGFIVVIVTLIGRPDVPTQSYIGEFDFNYKNPSFEGTATPSSLFIEKQDYPFPEVNLTAQWWRYSIWGFSIIALGPVPVLVENISGSFNVNFTRITALQVSGLDYFHVQSCGYWLNASTDNTDMKVHLEVNATLAYPIIRLTSNQPQSFADIHVSATFRPALAASRIVVSARDLTLQPETGSPLNLSGEVRLTFREFNVAYFWLTTEEGSLLLHPGSHFRWLDDSLSLQDVSGFVSASNGDERKFTNATLATLDAYRGVEFEVVALTGDHTHIVIHFILEATTLQVTDRDGTTIVGSQSNDLIQIDWWPGKSANIVIIIASMIAITILSWLKPDKD